MRRLDIVIPVYNEAEGLHEFHEGLRCALSALRGYRIGVIYVDDGSDDSTGAELEAIARGDHRVSTVSLSRNFGHQAALAAGLDLVDAYADAVLMLDGDGQHPPNLIPEMVKIFESGVDIVQTQRMADRKANRFKELTASGFYWLVGRIGEVDLRPGVADFRLLSRAALKALQAMPEYHKFFRGMVAWLGFKIAFVPYQPNLRVAGAPKYSFRKMLRLASHGIFSFSLVPLRLGIFIGLCFILLALAEFAYVTSYWVRGLSHLLVPGWSSLVILLTLSGAVTMITLGFIGIYVGMIFQEVKRRPVYVVASSKSARSEGPLSHVN